MSPSSEGPDRDGLGAEPTALQKRLTGYRDRVVDHAVLVLPLGVVSWMASMVNDRFLAQPWQIIWVVLPLIVVSIIAWRRVMRRGDLQLRGPMTGFLLVYLSVFLVAGASDLLVFRQETVTVPEGELAGSWLFPVNWGDWRYRLSVPPSGEELRLQVVTLEEPEAGTPIAARRLEVIRLIAVAARQGADAVALDFFFEQAAEPPAIDSLFCRTVRQARAGGTEVITGFRVSIGVHGQLVPDTMPALLRDEECVPRSQRAHLMALRDVDGTVRRVPLALRGAGQYRSMSVKVAQLLDDTVPLPEGRMVRFMEPVGGARTVSLTQLAGLSEGELEEVVQGRVLLVGERSGNETFSTPFGERLGVEVHGAAAATLATGGWVRPTPWWISLLMILAASLGVWEAVSAGVSPGRVGGVAVGFTVLLFAAAAASMRFWRLWIDVAYALTSLWLLTGALLLVRRKTERSTG